MKFESIATAWHCEHEKAAREAYIKIKHKSHKNFEVKESRLILNSLYPHFGVSPDGTIHCDCCGYGCLEIQCPYCLRNAWPEEVEEGATFPQKNMEVQLYKNRAYYYQIQTQIT